MKIRLILTLILVLVMLTGCAAQDNSILSGGEVKLVEEPGDLADYRPLVEGTVSFEKDESNRVTLDFPADGIAKSVKLQDDAGLTWELIIPAEALDHPEKIRMSSMKSIHSDLGEITGGVVLQPDGLRFLAPVTLRVSGGGMETAGMLFSGSHQGDELELSIVQKGQGAVEMQLFHFSTAYATDSDAVIAELAETAQGQVRKLSALAKQMLKQPIEAPVPPAIPIECHHETEDQDNTLISNYIKSFNKPEGDLIGALLAAKRALSLTSDHTLDFTDELRLTSRLMQKARALLKQYKGREEMFCAVAAASLNAERMAALLGAPLDGEESLLPSLAAWAQSIAQKYLDGLIKNHEYKNIHPAMKIIRQAALLGSLDADRLTQQLFDACTFTLRFEGTSTQKRDSSALWGTSGEALLTFGGPNANGMMFLGAAQGVHDRYSSTDPAAAKTLLTKEFESEAFLQLELPCYQTGKAYITRLGADVLVYQTDDGPITVPSFYNLVNQLVLDEYYDPGLQAVAVEIALVSGEAVIEQKMEGTYEYTTMTYTVSLEHTPK